MNIRIFSVCLVLIVEASAAISRAKGQPTGTWSRLSDGSEMLEVMAYDNLGNVCFSKVYGPYGHESTTTTSYHYSGQPSTVSYSEGSVAYTLVNTYTYDNCALYESQLSLNGSSHLLSRNGYDGFGRVTSVERGMQGGTSGLAYDLMGRLTSITHSRGFTQTLHYADGPGTPRYDGMVSAMSWKTGPGENRLRGYRYAYDGLGRLTEAVYGENTTLESNPNRYTERVLEYTANGNIRRFQRHGLKDDGVYGKIDNLHLTYDGNQLKSVLDDALPVTRYATADFADLSDGSTEYAYDECGAMISDSNQGILSISYDNCGNPRLTQFSTGELVEYVYTPTGQKVREIHRSPKSIVVGGPLPAPHEMDSDTTDYIGPVVYRNGQPDIVRYAGGYASLSKSGAKYVPAFHHYITDYLGNNRAVVRATDGAYVQVTHYYPWGSVYGDMGTGGSVQPYKYGDKELDLTAGVARYDYAARSYYAAIPRFDRPDALAGKYPHLSPYAFCANNPVNFTDPTGNILEFENATDEDMDNIVSKLHNIVKNGIEFSYDSNHRIIIKSGEENIDNLAPKSVAGIMIEIIKCDIETKIGIANDSEVLIGEIATERIDLHDIDKVNQEGLTPEGAFAHEIYENYRKAEYKHNKKTTIIPDGDIYLMHKQATNFENKVTGVLTTPERTINWEEGLIPVTVQFREPIILKFDPLTKNLY